MFISMCRTGKYVFTWWGRLNRVCPIGYSPENRPPHCAAPLSLVGIQGVQGVMRFCIAEWVGLFSGSSRWLSFTRALGLSGLWDKYSHVVLRLVRLLEALVEGTPVFAYLSRLLSDNSWSWLIFFCNWVLGTHRYCVAMGQVFGSFLFGYTRLQSGVLTGADGVCCYCRVYFGIQSRNRSDLCHGLLELE